MECSVSSWECFQVSIRFLSYTVEYGLCIWYWLPSGVPFVGHTLNISISVYRTYLKYLQGITLLLFELDDILYSWLGLWNFYFIPNVECKFPQQWPHTNLNHHTMSYLHSRPYLTPSTHYWSVSNRIITNQFSLDIWLSENKNWKTKTISRKTHDGSDSPKKNILSFKHSSFLSLFVDLLFNR